jgi:hypothetical protein
VEWVEAATRRIAEHRTDRARAASGRLESAQRPRQSHDEIGLGFAVLIEEEDVRHLRRARAEDPHAEIETRGEPAVARPLDERDARHVVKKGPKL